MTRQESTFGRVKKWLGTILALPVLVPLLAVVGALRLINEATTRAVGRAVVVCPHCGAPGIVESRDPRVMR